MRDYTGKTIFVGVDVHKKTYAVTVLCDEVVVKRNTLSASPEALLNYLRKYFSNAKIKTAYEAGFSGFGLHRYLLSNGIDNIVVHAASVEISARDRVKTDKRDSLKLATQLAAKRLKCIHIPTPEREAWREISRLREKVGRDKRRIGNRLKSLLYRQGLIAADDEDCVSKKWFEKIKQYKMAESIKYVMEVCIKQWLSLEHEIKEIDKALSEQAVADAALEKVYQSVPGIGDVHARALANELEDMSQFSNENKLFSFTGLTPSEHSSGEHKRQGHISRQGRSVLRKTLVEAAWVAIYRDPALMEIYQRILKVAGKKRAIIGVARRLIGRIRACFESGQLYEYGRSEALTVCRDTGEILMDVAS